MDLRSDESSSECGEDLIVAGVVHGHKFNCVEMLIVNGEFREVECAALV